MSDKSIEIIGKCDYKPIRVDFIDENGNSYNPFKVEMELENAGNKDE